MIGNKSIFFEYLTLRNFMSYGNVPTTIRLDTPGTTHIQGRNLDNTEQGIVSNGSGKTTIVHGLVYALYGETIDGDMKVDTLVNDRNNKDCEVQVKLRLDNDHYTITRYRKSKTGPESNYITIFKNDDQTNLAKATMNETNEWLEQLLCMPKNLFVRLVVYDADELSIFKLSAQKQRDLLENLFDITILSEKAESLKEKLKIYKSEFDLEQLKIEQLTQSYSQHEQRMLKAKQRVDEYQQNQINLKNELTSTLDKIESIDFDSELQKIKQRSDISNEIQIHKNELVELNSNHNNHKNTLSLFDQTLQNQTQTLENKYLQAKSSIQKQISDVSLEISSIQSSIKSKLDEINIHIPNQINDVDKKIDRIVSDISRLENDINVINEKLNKHKQHQCPECGQHINNANDKIDEYNKLLSQYNEKISQLRVDIHVDYLVKDDLQYKLKVEQESYDKFINESQLSDLNKQLSELKSDIDDIDKLKQQAIDQLILKNKDQRNDIQTLISQSLSVCNDLENVIKTKQKQCDDIHIRFSNEEKLHEYKQQKILIIKQLQDIDQTINPHLDAYEELKQYDQQPIDYTIMNDLKSKIDHTQFLIKSLTDKKSFIRRSLISSRLPYLNERLHKYLTQMGLPYQVEFLSDLTPSIKRRGKQMGFSNLSHGQKARVNFALSFAFRDIMEQMHRKVNLCILDEVLDKALCSVGANAAVSLITEKAKQDDISMFVITHKNELATKFKNHLIVTMQNGFSSCELKSNNS